MWKNFDDVFCSFNTILYSVQTDRRIDIGLRKDRFAIYPSWTAALCWRATEATMALTTFCDRLGELCHLSSPTAEPIQFIANAYGDLLVRILLAWTQNALYQTCKSRFLLQSTLRPSLVKNESSSTRRTFWQVKILFSWQFSTFSNSI